MLSTAYCARALAARNIEKDSVNEALAYIQQHPELSSDQIKQQVIAIKDIVQVHRDTGAAGFFKCTCNPYRRCSVSN